MEGRSIYDRVYYATHPDSVCAASQEDLRERYLITGLFTPGGLSLNYVHQERLIIGGAWPLHSPVALPAYSEPESLAGASLLANREMAVVNISTAVGIVRVDGQAFHLKPNDALYIGRGAEAVSFESTDPATPAKFYIASTPAHRTFETKQISIAFANPLKRGDQGNANSRTIYQLVVPGVCQSAQLLVGLTILEPGSVWNTMPPHLHDRRSEVYFYFDLEQPGCVFHFMGRPQEMRHLVASNEQAVICPPWSLHAGTGTSRYAFIWAMGGENLDYNDMNNLDICQLK